MRVIDIAGRLQTAGSWAETAESEADAQALLRHTRAGLRRMLDGNEQFHVDPMAAPAVWIGVDMAKPGSDTTVWLDPAVIRAAIRPTGQPADVWHTEAPPQPGVYEATYKEYLPCGSGHKCRWTGDHWTGTWSDDSSAEAIAAVQSFVRPAGLIVWLHLISADTPPIADWRPGDQVPEGERKQGLWHCKDVRGVASDALRAEQLAFGGRLPGFLYRPAAPGVREGEAYDESKYGVAG